FYPTGAATRRLEILDDLQAFPFQGVRRWLTKLIESGDRARVVPQQVINVVGDHGELIADMVVCGEC
ncbi:hypothetical protein, partial [Nocardia sp. NPDC058497]|uniref:hypothetical protein n=1 Tax=Nocardia sp. NPDC058497 TaxID=3346529 RepID=UPI00365EB3CC